MSGSSRDVADSTPPKVLTYPVDDHDVRDSLVFTFDEPVRLGAGTVRLHLSGQGYVYSADVTGNPHLTVAGNTVTFDPPDELQPKGLYTIVFSAAAIVDLAGNEVTPDGVIALFRSGISPRPVDASGTDQNDTIHGSDFADTLSGGSGGIDSLFGYGGDDVLSGGDEPVRFGVYGDALYGGEGNDTLYGNGGSDQLYGDAGDDQLFGGADRDYLNGGAGDDLLEGGDGDDSLYDDAGDNILRGGEGKDFLSSQAGATGVLEGGDGDDTLVGHGGVDFFGGAGNDTFRVLLDDAAATSGVVEGGAGDDRIELWLNRPADARLDIDGGGGIDTYVLQSADFAGGAAAVVRIGDFAAGAGGDRIDLAALLASDYDGNPFISGDVRLWQSGADTLLQLRDPGAPGRYLTLLTLAGVDAASLAPANFVGGLDPAGSSAGLTLEGTASADGLTGMMADDLIRGYGGNDLLAGAGGDDLLDGGDGDDRLSGGRGDDELRGGAGNDILDESTDPSGSDRLIGGAGDDILTIASSGANVLEGGTGADTFVIAGPQAQARILDLSTAEGDTLDLRAILPASLSDNPFGPAGYLKAEQVGDDVLIRFDQDGAAGSAHALRPLLTLADTSLSGLSRASFIGGYDWRGAEAGDTLIGTEGDDTLRGQDLDDIIRGYGGNDDLFGGGGDDLLEGGDESGWNGDDMWGGRGNDVMLGGLGNDKLFGEEGDDRLVGGGGNDFLLDSSGNDIFEGGDGDDRISTVASSSSTDTTPYRLHIDGGAGNDEIDTTLEAERVLGGDGNDTITIHSSIKDLAGQAPARIDGGDGDDQVTLATWDAVPWAVEIAGGAGSDTFAFNSGAAMPLAVITDFVAGQGGDLLDLFSLVDYQENSGNPLRAGGQLRLVQQGADTVVQRTAPGPVADWHDVVVLRGVLASSLTGANFVDGVRPDGSPTGLEITGTVNLDFLVGGRLDDTLRGGDAKDRLFGAGGDDILYGDGGDDELYGEGGNDLLVGGAGNDRLSDDEGLNRLEGGDGDDAVWSDSPEGGELLGGAGNDGLLFNGGGNATLDGGSGDDTFVVTNYLRDVPTATVVIHGGEGDDSIEAALGAGQQMNVVADGGAGRDTFHLRSAPLGASSFTVLDFQAGANGDRISLGQFISNTPWDSQAFGSSGFLRLVQQGADTVLMFDQDGTGSAYDFVKVMTLVGVDAARLTSDNFAGGLDPHPAAPPPTPPTPPSPPSPQSPPPVTPPPPVTTAPPVTAVGSDGNDVLVGGRGNDILVGGAGIDRAVYTGASSNYTVTRGPNGFQVLDKRGALGDGTDLLSGVERITFADGHLALDTDGVAGQAFRIYRAAFDRAPDLGGMGFYLSVMDAGLSVFEVAATFVASQEFRDKYGVDPDNADALTRMYQNVLHREPDREGYLYWLDVLDTNKASLSAVLASISESNENHEAVAELIANGVPFTPWA